MKNYFKPHFLLDNGKWTATQTRDTETLSTFKNSIDLQIYINLELIILLLSTGDYGKAMRELY